VVEAPDLGVRVGRFGDGEGGYRDVRIGGCELIDDSQRRVVGETAGEEDLVVRIVLLKECLEIRFETVVQPVERLQYGDGRANLTAGPTL